MMFLIINSADIEAINTSGESALTIALKRNHPEVARHLFKKYASVSSLASACPLFQRIPEEALKNRVDGLVALFESAGLPTDLAEFLVKYVT